MTTKVLVYHADETLFSDSLMYRRDGRLFNAAMALAIFHSFPCKPQYVLVGEVKVADYDDINFQLDDAWGMTQNINDNWNKKNPCRSTSVGDIFAIGSKIYIVGPAGFDLIEG